MKARTPRLLIFLIMLTAMTIVGYLILEDENYAFEKLEGEIFSTHYQVTYQPNAALKLDPRDIQSAIEKELNRIDWIASSWKKESELSRYNRSANKEEFLLSSDLKWLIERSRQRQPRSLWHRQGLRRGSHCRVPDRRSRHQIVSRGHRW
jgi:thiamine biosynthesis lipoprotein ApbE